MRRVAAILVGLVLLGIAHGPRGAALLAQQPPTAPQHAAQLTFLQLNDVYSAVPVNGQGGLARVAALKKQWVAEGHPVIMTLSGDFLSPSVASTVFKGEQMVAALNAAGLDFATLGNHEFDFGRDTLVQRIAESKFQWIISNVIDERTNRPVGDARPYLIRDFGPLKVGFIGLCLISTNQIAASHSAGLRLVDPLEAAAQYVPILKREGANVIVAITHLTFAEDRALVRRFPEIDLVIGGHEHYVITATENHALISKAGSDAKMVGRIDVDRAADGEVERFFELYPVTSTIPDDPETASVIASYEARLGKELDAIVGASTEPLDATDRRLYGESNLGDLMADAIRANAGADIGLTNGGGIRGGVMYPAGPISKRMLLSIHPFSNIVCKVAVSGRVLLDALNNGVSRLPTLAGQFPQVSGLTMTVDPRAPVGQRVTNVRVNGQPLDADRTYTLALPDYVLTGGDNYGMFAGQKVLIAPESGDLIVDALERYVRAKGTVAPRTEGRITVN